MNQSIECSQLSGRQGCAVGNFWGRILDTLMAVGRLSRGKDGKEGEAGEAGEGEGLEAEKSVWTHGLYKVVC